MSFTGATPVFSYGGVEVIFMGVPGADLNSHDIGTVAQ